MRHLVDDGGSDVGRLPLQHIQIKEHRPEPRLVKRGTPTRKGYRVHIASQALETTSIKRANEIDSGAALIKKDYAVREHTGA